MLISRYLLLILILFKIHWRRNLLNTSFVLKACKSPQTLSKTEHFGKTSMKIRRYSALFKEIS